MGSFVNPGNGAFQVALNSEIYVDKTGLMEYINSVMNTLQAYICNSRPRRFGKSVTANMLAAYYSRGCNSEKMFADFVFLPKPEYVHEYPALLVELKWNQNVQTAMQQIKDKKYPTGVAQYTGEILLVAINYDKKQKNISVQ